MVVDSSTATPHPPRQVMACPLASLFRVLVDHVYRFQFRLKWRRYFAFIFIFFFSIFLSFSFGSIFIFAGGIRCVLFFLSIFVVFFSFLVSSLIKQIKNISIYTIWNNMCHTVLLLLFLLLVLSVNNFTHISKYEYTFFVENIFCLPLQFPFSFFLQFLMCFFLFLFFPPLSSIAKCFRLAVWISNHLLLFDVIKQQGTKLAEEREESKIGGAGNAMIINKVAGAELATKKGFKMRDHRETRLRDHIRSAWGNNERVPSLKKTVNGISIWSMMQEAGSPIKREEVLLFSKTLERCTVLLLV